MNIYVYNLEYTEVVKTNSLKVACNAFFKMHPFFKATEEHKKMIFECLKNDKCFNVGGVFISIRK